jgi:hypothetical protein
VQFTLRRLFAAVTLIALVAGLAKAAPFWTLLATIFGLIAAGGIALAKRLSRAVDLGTPLVGYVCVSSIAIASFYFAMFGAFGFVVSVVHAIAAVFPH